MKNNTPIDPITPLAKAIADLILTELKKDLLLINYYQEPATEEKILSQKEACRFLKVSRQTLNSYERKGAIKVIRLVPGGKPMYSEANLFSIKKNNGQ